jgi:hypothetical protein
LIQIADGVLRRGSVDAVIRDEHIGAVCAR